MKQIDFSQNWGGKLDNRTFTTIRLRKAGRIKNELYEVRCEDAHVGYATLTNVGVLTLDTLTEEIACEDVGCSLEQAKAILKEIYPQIEGYTPLDYLHFKFERNDKYIKAYQIAEKAHEGQTDKSGAPYFGHVLRVSAMGSSDTERIVGLLHDIIEDTDWDESMLEAEGFSTEEIETIKCVTKTSEDEPYDDFIERIAANPLAIAVKLNDLRDNMDVTRLAEISDKDIKRMRKYFKAYNRLKQ